MKFVQRLRAREKALAEADALWAKWIDARRACGAGQRGPLPASATSDQIEAVGRAAQALIAARKAVPVVRVAPKKRNKPKRIATNRRRVVMGWL